MTDEELNALAAKLANVGLGDDVWTSTSNGLRRSAASALRQLMREIKLADFEIQLLKMQLADDPTHPLAPS